ncbi:unnamed protein product [Lymnaea stagnalis]|uniref:Hexosyltransferase n=1 Tax=Lymnaea stagnalis TaxID=6523 RepID=A0AAV2HLB3_LYMST
MADMNVGSYLSMNSTRPNRPNPGSNNMMRSADSVKNLDLIITDTKTSAKNLSSKVIGDRGTLNTGSSVQERAFIGVQNGRSQMGMVTPYRADNAENTMASKLNTTAATRSVSVSGNNVMNSGSPTTGYGSTVRDVKRQEDRVNDDSAASTGSAPFQYYRTNLSDTSFYDNQIKVVMETKDACADASLYDAVMTVHSSPANIQKRRTFRWLYGDQEQTHSYKIKVIFLVGLVNNRTLQRSLELENHLHNDIVQGNFLDTYRNLTYKAVFGFHWVATRCKGLRLLLRLDDDVFLATDRFFSAWNQRKTNTSDKTVLCDILKNDVVRRVGKWRVSETLVAEAKYTFPHCLGYFAAITPGLVYDVSEVSKRTPFFWIDDVFIYGFVMSRIRGVNFLPAKEGSLRKKHAQFERCLLVNGPRGCPSWLVIGDPKSFKKLYHLFYGDNARDATPTLKSS